jgi:uncharacterized tellurite resistance protein B-like protein
MPNEKREFNPARKKKRQFVVFEKLMARLRGENNNKLTNIELRLAVAGLLASAERSDVSETELENSVIEDSLVYLYHISRDEARELAVNGAKVEEACVDIKDLTELIKSHLTQTEREQILSEIWEVLVVDHVVGVREKSFSKRMTSLLALSSERGELVRQSVMEKTTD